ncbi:hypothetical protein SMALB_6180 [Streptomyces malaysiensis]|uniref:Uncharacterized protein n=1 Tax=Streptomyces malaysiensis TaxID=92644 RepID=A0A7X5X7L7_STRMQ|nr:hypothetical protein [Streptomyces malaysiensis]
MDYGREDQEFQICFQCYQGPAGLEYVAAAYEELGARADSDADLSNEFLYHYADVAYGEAYWISKKYDQKWR